MAVAQSSSSISIQMMHDSAAPECDIFNLRFNSSYLNVTLTNDKRHVTGFRPIGEVLRRWSCDNTTCYVLPPLWTVLRFTLEATCISNDEPSPMLQSSQLHTAIVHNEGKLRTHCYLRLPCCTGVEGSQLFKLKAEINASTDQLYSNSPSVCQRQKLYVSDGDRKLHQHDTQWAV